MEFELRDPPRSVQSGALPTEPTGRLLRKVEMRCRSKDRNRTKRKFVEVWNSDLELIFRMAVDVPIRPSSSRLSFHFHAAIIW